MLVVFLVPAVVLTLGVNALWLWARWLSRRYGCPRWVRYLPVPIVLTWLLGAGATAYGLNVAFGAVSGDRASAEGKARMLAEGISESMNGTALSAVGIALWVLVLLALTYKFHWSARGPKTPGDPPYR